MGVNILNDLLWSIKVIYMEDFEKHAKYISKVKDTNKPTI